MERRALLAVVISLAILVIYQEIVIKRVLGPAPASETAGEEVPPPGEGPSARAPSESIPPALAVPEPRPAVVSPAEAPEIAVETDLYSAVFTAAGGRLRSLTLRNYRTERDRNSPPLQMVQVGAGGELPLAVTLSGATSVSDDAAVYQILGEPLRLTGEQSGTVTLRWEGPGVVLEKRFRFTGNQYPIQLEVAPLAVPEGTVEVGLSWTNRVDPGHGSRYEGLVALLNNKVLHRSYEDAEKGEILSGTLGWAGRGDQYFLAAMIPEGAADDRLWLKLRESTAEVRVLTPVAGSEAMPFQIYLGPKDFDVLEAVGHQLARAIDFGYFAVVAIPFLRALKLSHRLTANYGVDIILLTLAIKILFIPLTQKSFKSMKEMQKLQPQMAKLRERLKDKPEEMNKEIMELYRRHKVNPLGGCLPMVLQIPVFIGLYNALLSAIELRHAAFALWINDLSQPDRLGNLALPFVHPPGIPVLTLVMGGTMFVQQWMTPTVGDPTQQRMMMIMPLVFTFMFINFPSGLVLYWLVNNVLTIAQQYYITRAAD